MLNPSIRQAGRINKHDGSLGVGAVNPLGARFQEQPVASACRHSSIFQREAQALAHSHLLQPTHLPLGQRFERTYFRRANGGRRWPGADRRQFGWAARRPRNRNGPCVLPAALGLAVNRAPRLRGLPTCRCQRQRTPADSCSPDKRAPPNDETLVHTGDKQRPRGRAQNSIALATLSGPPRQP